MSIWRLVACEIAHRWGHFLAGTAAAAAAVACLLGSVTVLRIHDLRTRALLAAKRRALQARLSARERETRRQMGELEERMRKSMKKLGFNVVILPAGLELSDWYDRGFGDVYMPEKYVHTLASSRIMTVRHLLPILQRRVTWPETRRSVILVGTRGEVPLLHRDPKRPLTQPVPEGGMVVGYELQQSLGLRVGDKVRFMGREFKVHRCHGQRGNRDDITVWIALTAAQELLGKPGKINAIMALDCRCAWADLAKVRKDIRSILPHTQVIEQASKALARAEARQEVERKARAVMERERRDARAALEHERVTRGQLRRQRERAAALLVILTTLAAAVWIAYLAASNVRERRSEIGILAALGLGPSRVLRLFLLRAMACGLGGGLLGAAVGLFGGRRLALGLERVAASAVGAGGWCDPGTVVAAVLMAPLLAILAACIPALAAARADPAAVLRND